MNAVTAVILRLHLENRAFTRDAPLVSVADERARREGNLHALRPGPKRGTLDLNAVE